MIEGTEKKSDKIEVNFEDYPIEGTEKKSFKIEVLSRLG
jgi:hypothetical protein